jgi:hypothetical protein
MNFNRQDATGSVSISSEPQNFIDFNNAWNLVRDQEVDGSNPFAPTTSFAAEPASTRSPTSISIIPAWLKNAE